ncbi:MAG TPA: helix-turn-helix domain-containing protein [Solirubrobacteraceae bacterium]|jgi:DNA-binding MarR family transcriptional regulator|nr:helix-turn-helix domain-containing protein [Solirubrobacteraceae bacterium]
MPRRESVLVALSPEQVDAVIRCASDGGNLALLLSGADMRGAADKADALLQEGGLSRALLYGLMLLAALPSDGSYASITSLSRTLGMTMSTAHRYLSTLVAVGLVDREPASREYRLGHVR